MLVLPPRRIRPCTGLLIITAAVVHSSVWVRPTKRSNTILCILRYLRSVARQLTSALPHMKQTEKGERLGPTR